jgi:hypothetical protein
MRKIEPWKTWTFVGSLAVLGFVIRLIVVPFPSETEQAQSSSTGTANANSTMQAPVPNAVVVANQKTPEQLAAERARYLARYLNIREERRQGTTVIGVAVVGDGNKLNGALGTILANRIKSASVRSLTSVFTPEFVSDGLFEKAFHDSSDVFSDLELGKIMNAALLARQTVEYSTTASLENLITANMQLEVMLVSISPRSTSQTWTFTANGPGFKQSDARLAAEERIVKQLTNDTRISTALFNP